MTTSIKPTCPRCSTEITRRRRIHGVLCCPCCTQPVYEINGFFSTEEQPALSVKLWKHFVHRVLIKEKLDISVPKGSPGWKKELGFAIRLLKACYGDIDLAIETIDQHFNQKGLNWKTRTSLWHCLGPDFRLAHAAAKRAIERQRAEETVVSRNVSAIQVPMPTF